MTICYCPGRGDNWHSRGAPGCFCTPTPSVSSDETDLSRSNNGLRDTAERAGGETVAAVREALRQNLCGFEYDGDQMVRFELLGSLDSIAGEVAAALSEREES